MSNTSSVGEMAADIDGADAIKSITVSLEKNAYDILISCDWLDQACRKLRALGLSDDIMVFTSPRIGGLYFDKVKRDLKAAGFNKICRHDIPDGENNKNSDSYMACHDALLREFPEPGEVPLVVNLGGGVVGDVGGFAAATLMRGIPYVQIPTTLLGDVDCGVGGKVAINRNRIKNIIGTFYQPRLVIVDYSFLETLDVREVQSGTAEVIKYGFVCSATLFQRLEERIEDLVSLDPEMVSHISYQCLRLKAVIVEDDERDTKDKRIVLNFGHTVGHALEMASNLQMTHGEAISVGMLAATKISIKLGNCSPALYDRLESVIKRAGLPTDARGMNIGLDDVIEIMRHDKKSINGKSRFVLPREIADWYITDQVPSELVRDIVESYL